MLTKNISFMSGERPPKANAADYNQGRQGIDCIIRNPRLVALLSDKEQKVLCYLYKFFEHREEDLVREKKS